MWTIIPLKLGVTTVWRGGFVMQQGLAASERFEVPHVAWLLKEDGGSRRILVDAGISGNLEIGRAHV